jgi:hypothetical protein
MKVKEFIEWLKTQDQDRIIEVLTKEPTSPNRSWSEDTYRYEPFDPQKHTSTFFEGYLELGNDD